jgi:hypothetical protein
MCYPSCGQCWLGPVALLITALLACLLTGWFVDTFCYKCSPHAILANIRFAENLYCDLPHVYIFFVEPDYFRNVKIHFFATRVFSFSCHGL